MKKAKDLSRAERLEIGILLGERIFIAEHSPRTLLESQYDLVLHGNSDGNPQATG